MKKFLVNKVREFRDVVVIGIIMIYFGLILYPLMLLGACIVYIVAALISWDWKELRNIKKFHQAYEKYVQALD